MTAADPNPKVARMDLTIYQERAGETDILSKNDALMPLLGLAGEVGQLIAEYKKRQRDVHGYRAFKDEVSEELVVRRGFDLVGQGGATSTDLGDDLLRRGVPDEGFGVVVPVRCPQVDGLVERGDASRSCRA